MGEFYIKKLSLKNFRGFTEKEFTLDKRMNVFIGRNGSGKTSILEAANVILGAYLSAYSKYVNSRYVYNIKATDPHLSIKKVSIEESKKSGTVLPDSIMLYPCEVHAEIKWCGKKNDIDFRRVLAKQGARTKFDGKNPMQPDVQKWEEYLEHRLDIEHGLVLPVVLYLSSKRLWNSRPVKCANSVPPRTDGYKDCLNPEHGIYMALEYLRTLKNFASEEREGKDYPAFKAIESAVDKVLRSELKDDEKVVFSSRFNDMLALQTSDDVLIPFDALSDGYRNVIKIILDVATRICMLNPALGDRALQETPGIVIIDELDLSLHPTWQKRIVKLLKELFPRVQFICATHSPFIIQSLQPVELQVLDTISELDTSSCTSGIEDIAENLMGVRMPQYSAQRIEMYDAAKEYYEAVKKAINKDDIKMLRKKLAVLEARYSENPAYLAYLENSLNKKKLW